MRTTRSRRGLPIDTRRRRDLPAPARSIPFGEGALRDLLRGYAPPDLIAIPVYGVLCLLSRIIGRDNLSILMRLLIGAGTPKEAAARGRMFLLVAYSDHTLAIFIFTLDEASRGIPAVIVVTEPI